MMFVSCVRALCSESAELWAQRKLPEAHERETVDEARARWLALTLRPKDTFVGLLVRAILHVRGEGIFRGSLSGRAKARAMGNTRISKGVMISRS